MQKGTVLENIKIDKLIFGWKALGFAPDGKKIIISGWVIPGSVINLRILKNRKNYYEGQMLDEVKKSPLEQKLPDHFQVYGGCKWLPIAHDVQLQIKQEQVKEAFNHLKEYVTDTVFHPIVASPEIYGYRNKVEFSWWKYISDREWVHDEFRFWFHKQWEFDRIIDCTFCVLADDEINEIFKKTDSFSRWSGLPTYDPKRQEWFWRHLVIRKSKHCNEIMLIFSVNDDFLASKWSSTIDNFSKNLKWFLDKLTKEYPNIKSIYYLRNNWKADIVTWEFELYYWVPAIKEKLLDKTFEINPKSFFQTNSLGAEKLYQIAIDMAKKWKEELKWGTMLDLYAWTWTLWIIFSPFFKNVYSVEIVKEASEDGKRNAKLNGINNIEFVNAKVENFLKDFSEKNEKVDLLVIDPPRDWMHPDALPNVVNFDAKAMIYISCNPSTLARDLDYIVKNSSYKITDITPVDMFPHTHHIETVVRLEK
ncbi:MAG: 23S rRNA m(5)U-1939 methyltransferase [uncultured bacterium (gcode 4)]|uniref:23S rRNA m(5)U-1939 methyltransferase n=1 Tax=uncultured bacterium (gcode 4) TaxID=1234023 RepID=K2F809_9BACT|nr:MAG: 23S rRNA m(5)U-1939 methyltransferase [uncultured bacterium (gcode 4)]